MMKILFIASKHLDYCGGEACTLRNLDILKQLYSPENVIEFRISRNTTYKTKLKAFWYIKGFINDISMNSIGGLDKKQLNKIHKIIKNNKIDSVFLDNSTFGNLAKQIKTNFPQVQICTFFHNIEYLYYKQEFKVQKNHLLRYRIGILKKNETNACKYSDSIIALNQRDAHIIESVYHRKTNHIIPISLKDSYRSLPDLSPNKQKTGLFIGSYFSLNIEGILHFIHHIFPHTDIKLIIAGSGMNKLKTLFTENPKIEIHDYTKNLTPFYEAADFVVIPIFSGSGMKVKTTEALMHGKYIIGSTEAFEGYNINEAIGKECKNDSDFIKAINEYNINEKFNCFSRNLYLTSYSYEASLESFKKIFH